MHGRFSLVVSAVVVLSACGLPPDAMDRTNTLDSALGIADDQQKPEPASPSNGVQCADVFVSSDACLDATTFKQKMIGACTAQGLELTNYRNLVSCGVDAYKAGDVTCCKKAALPPPPPPPPAPRCFESTVTKGGFCVGESKLKLEASTLCANAGGTLTKIDYVRTGCTGLDAVKAQYSCCL